MRFDATQQMRMGQHMKLAPRMIQSMEILQMPMLQLEERIAQELESNATLEIVENGAGMELRAPEPPQVDNDLDLPMRVDENHAEDDFARLDSFEQSNPEGAENQFDEGVHDHSGVLEGRQDFDRLSNRLSNDLQGAGSEISGSGSARFDGESDPKSLAMANTASRSASLAEQLRDQWMLADVDPILRPLGEQIIGFIDDNGYVREPLEVIIDRLPTTIPKPAPELMERALQALQLMLEPPGVAARNTRECLLLQVDAIIAEKAGELTQDELDRWGLVRRLIAEHLDDLAQNRLPRISEKIGQPFERIKGAMEKMKLLSLSPARQLVEDPPSVIVPDAVVEYDADADRYIAYLNDSRLPNLRVNQEYAMLAKDRTAPKPTREFVKKNLSNAMWLIDAVEQRRRTLLRVVEAVVAAQREYFDFGPQSLRPLPMTQVAEQLGVHVATVSRAVADKHLATPRGIWPLRKFFSGGVQTKATEAGGSEDLAWDAIKAALQEIIDAEDKASPLSDESLVDELKKRGIEIARRTVAKYRDQLQIPPKRLRKKF